MISSDRHVDITKPYGYFDCHGSTGRHTAYMCETCGALIAMDYVWRHEQWHEKLRRAVDETGMLG